MRLALSNFDARQLRNLLRSGDRRASCEALERFEMLLLDFGLPCKLFRAAMKTYGIIGSGSTTIWLLLPRTSTIAYHDFDLYVNVNFFAEFLSWMLQNTSYITDSQQEAQWKASISDLSGFNGLYDTVTGSNGIVHVHNLIDTAKGKKIQLILISMHTLNPFAVMGAFHSTCLMNAISHRGLLCAYPELTLCRRSILNTSGSSWPAPLTKRGVKAEHVETYRGRGFEFGSDYFDFWDFNGGMEDIVGFSSHECGQWAYCPRTRRSLLDEGMLLLPFEGCTELQFRQDLPVFFWSMANNGHCNAGDDESDDGFIQEDGLGQKRKLQPLSGNDYG
ncbi:hypothetical protein BKA70DRAFT_1104862 [Coprinopsis sp. MPI-PUGE-AT-0042]|nr:hypothetical protein BKA70DRAFT_1104862 [Coprinopsis sp. MPI-PUGE-AT-0042]